MAFGFVEIQNKQMFSRLNNFKDFLTQRARNFSNRRPAMSPGLYELHLQKIVEDTVNGKKTLNTKPRNLHATAAARFRTDSVRMFVRIIENSLSTIVQSILPGIYNPR